MKTYWLSFCDEATGQNTGVCVVEVAEEQLELAAEVIEKAKPISLAGDDDKWVLAAIAQSLMMECNPGGAVEALEVDPTQLPADLPKNRLILPDELKQNGWI